MKPERWRIGATVPQKIRTELLYRFPPRFQEVFAASMTMAYDVTWEFRVPPSPVECIVIGYHRAAKHEALVCHVDRLSHRPDGKRFHITLSVERGTRPVTAGDIVDRHIEMLPLSERISFPLLFQRLKLQVQRPDVNTSRQSISA